MEAYCMKCKGKQTMSNPQEITMKNTMDQEKTIYETIRM